MKILKEYDGSVLISREDYDKMLQNIDWLECLYDAGVDNWEGFDEARNLYKELMNEQE